MPVVFFTHSSDVVSIEGANNCHLVPLVNCDFGQLSIYQMTQTRVSCSSLGSYAICLNSFPHCLLWRNASVMKHNRFQLNECNSRDCPIATVNENAGFIRFAHKCIGPIWLLVTLLWYSKKNPHIRNSLTGNSRLTFSNLCTKVWKNCEPDFSSFSRVLIFLKGLSRENPS